MFSEPFQVKMGRLVLGSGPSLRMHTKGRYVPDELHDGDGRVI